MPGLGRYPCPSCHYVAGNRRMLARHAVLIHSEKVFKCPVCPFITRYAANWYRHKRDLHGLTKVTNCELCGFFADSTEELARHKEAEHPEQLQKEKYEDKYAKEKLRLTGVPKQSPKEKGQLTGIVKEPPKEKLQLSGGVKEPHKEKLQLSGVKKEPIKEKLTIKVEEPSNENTTGVVEELFPEVVTVLEEGVGDVQINQSNVTDDFQDDFGDDQRDSITFSLPINGFLYTNGCDNSTESGNLTANGAINVSPSGSDTLGPLKVKRSYNCDQCGLLTSNPREYLYHLRDIHGEKISVFECKYCIYASKHIQKLTRHCNLVHRLLIAKDPEYIKSLEALKEKRSRPIMNKISTRYLPIAPKTNNIINNNSPNPNVFSRPVRPLLPFKCSVCPYQTRDKGYLAQHQKTAHLKKKLFHCLQCGYTTNERARYTKHIKYHSLPKMQCEHCFFKTAYKWNMERHMKNHESGAEGAFQCTTCNFTTSTKQSFKSHINNHHNSSPGDEYVPEEVNDSTEWEDMEEMGAEESNEGYPVSDENGSMGSYDYQDMRESSSQWNDESSQKQQLQCKICDFKAQWPFELRRHEENHKSQKKHPCPLCGMRFEHIAWLTKHLRRVHQENSQAGNLAAAFEMMKPGRRKPQVKEYSSDSVLPMFQEVLKPNNAVTNKVQEPPQPQKNSMLSSLLSKPLTPSTSSNKFMAPYKSKVFASSSNMSRQLRISNYYDKVPFDSSSSVAKPKMRGVPTCNVCGYKTRWISELQRHMRVHSEDKPFHCPKCKYHCKWKGDLNRHLMKYHGIKVPQSNKKPGPMQRFRSGMPGGDEDWQMDDEEALSHQRTPARNSTSDAPLDLTTKDTFPHPYDNNADAYDPYEFENFSSATDNAYVDVETNDERDSASTYKSPLQQMQEVSNNSTDETSKTTKRKYQCPFCSFGTTTASRFHVHVVQHYNRRPFMCSVCGYNSNWEWDITKHIRLKGCKDKFQKACVLLTDESGRRNYEKYDKYLVDIDQPPPANFIKPPGITSTPNLESKYSMNRSANESHQKTCSYDFRNIGSNFEDTTENIVVTPDIDISEMLQVNLTVPHQSVPSGPEAQSNGDGKNFYCKHCNFKHATKRVVISHLSVHAGIKPFRCRACGIASNWRHVIVRHVKDVHNGYMNEVEDRIHFTQEGFGLRLTSIPSAANQNSTVTPTSQRKEYTPQFGCKVCPYKCDKEFYIEFHMKQHRPREGAVFKCDYCPYYVKFKKTLVRHMKLHNPSMVANTFGNDFDELDTDEPEVECQVDVQPSNVYDFYDGQENESADDSIAISFDTLNQFTHSDPVSPQKIKRHVCENCPYKTDNKTQYLYHKQFHRPNPSAPFKCTVCTYWATMQHLMTQHMKVHSESGTTDSESSPDKSQLERSLVTYGNKRGAKHDLTMANKGAATDGDISFVSDDNWEERMIVTYVKKGDDIIKMFKCKFCPMMNRKRGNVRVHQKMHGVIVKDGQFACSYCDYQCLNQGGLTNHLKIHQKLPEEEAYPDQVFYDSPQKMKNDASSVIMNSVCKKYFSYFCKKCPAMFKSSSDLDVHLKFHGSSLPFPCTVCDYRAKHKPHLEKHLTVHTPDYQNRRSASQAGMKELNSIVSDPMLEINDIPIVKKIDQMLLLEATEMSTALKKTGEAAAHLQKCLFCPAPFAKVSTLTYHISLHGSDGQYKCSQCDYAVNREMNLTVHSMIHPKKKVTLKAPVLKLKKPPPRKLQCPKCPAVFDKQDRFDRHFDLHGKGSKFVCEHCDYSVRFAANLIKHRAVHNSVKADAENATSPSKATDIIAAEPTATGAPLSENTNLIDFDDKKTTYICDRCPYTQNRKDAVQSHQRRHWYKDGLKCPYCDYTSMQTGFVLSHIKLHVQTQHLFPAQAFMKYEGVKIFCKDEDQESLLFDDQEMENEKQQEKEEKKSKKRKRAEGSAERKKSRKPSCDSVSMDSSDSLNKTKVPVVVLSDILTDKDFKKYAPKLKIPKLKITKHTDAVTSQKVYSKISISYDSEDRLQTTWSKPKPSLVVKIKVDNSTNNEKAVYSVATKTSETYEHLSISAPKKSPSEDEELDKCTVNKVDDSGVETVSTEESGTGFTSVVNSEESTKESEDSVLEPMDTSDETPLGLNGEADLKSDESFSSDTVQDPIVEGVCEKLSVVPELTFSSDLTIANGCLTNGLTSSLPCDVKL